MEAASTIAAFVQAFTVRVDRSAECWLWTGSLQQDGYGRFIFRRRQFLAHRVAFFLAHGRWVPSSGATDHLCRVRRCVNPAHLDETTRGDNVRRGLVGRPKPWLRKTHCYRGHPYDEANTYVDPSGGRHCRACHAITQKPINERNRSKK
jgi:hypothetical protein